MSEPWVVLKFGGTSVAGRPQWDTISSLVAERRAAGNRVLLVGSALDGVTDSLISLADDAGSGDVVDRLMDRHVRLAKALDIDAMDILREGRALVESALEDQLANPGPRHRAALLATGEWLSTRLGAAFLGVERAVGWVDAREALVASPEPDPDSARAWLSARSDSYQDERLRADWSQR